MNNQMNKSVEDRIREAARNVEPRPEFSNSLWRQIAAAPQPAPVSSSRRWFTRPAWVLASAALALALMAAAYGPQKVVAAFQAILGYIPGIGFVQQDDNTKYLAAPLSVKQDGVTLTVDQAVADVDGVVISYHMEGLPAVKPDEGVVCVFSDNRVRLPDGKDRLPIGGEVIGSKARIEFGPLPAGVNQLTLLVHGEPECPAPIDWSVDIPFGTKAPQPALPVAEVTQMASETPKTQAAETVRAKSDDVRMTVEKTVALADGWLITGHMTWDDP